MRYRLVAAILLFLIACVVQFSLASAGISIDLVLAALIAFAFFFSFLEVLVFVLCGVFLMNWQPGFSFEMLIFAALPLAAFFFHRAFAWAPWAGIPVMTVCGFAAFYALIAPSLFVIDPAKIVLDVVGSLIFGEITLAALNRAER
jgi:hypothetical protein